MLVQSQTSASGGFFVRCNSLTIEVSTIPTLLVNLDLPCSKLFSVFLTSLNVFCLDMAFLLPATRGIRSPLANTLRFTLLFEMAALYATDKD